MISMPSSADKKQAWDAVHAAYKGAPLINATPKRKTIGDLRAEARARKEKVAPIGTVRYDEGEFEDVDLETGKILKKEPNDDILAELEKVIAEAEQASKEGGAYKKRDNWKGKAGYVKKIDALWNKYSGGADKFYGKLSGSMSAWKPKSKGGDSHASRMYEKHGVNVD